MPRGKGTYGSKVGRPKKSKIRKAKRKTKKLYKVLKKAGVFKGPVKKQKKWDTLKIKKVDEVMVRKKLDKGLVKIQSMELL